MKRIPAPICAEPSCSTRLRPGRGNNSGRCFAHRRCSVCGAVMATCKSRDDQFPGFWCQTCLSRHQAGDVKGRAWVTPAPERFTALCGEPDPLTGCIPWRGTRGTKGHGYFSVARKQIGAHRYALETSLGRPLRDGMQALHHCDNPPCVNPEHLYEGTPMQNARDAILRGQLTGGRFLTLTQLREVRDGYAAGVAQRALAAEYGISLPRVQSIVNRVGVYALIDTDDTEPLQTEYIRADAQTPNHCVTKKAG